MNKTKHAVIIALFASMGNGANHYTRASVDKVKILLEKYHHITIKRRWLFYCLRDIEEAGYIRRKRRYVQGDDTDIRQLPSLVSFTLSGVKYLVRKRISGAMSLLKSITRFLSKNDKRFPGERENEPEHTAAEILENKRRFKKLLKGLA